MFDSRQMKEFPGLKFAFNVLRWFLLIAGLTIWIMHHFGNRSTCYTFINSGSDTSVTTSLVADYCQDRQFRRDRYYFLLEASILCFLQWAWYKSSRKFTGVDALMRLFYEFATRRMHDLDRIKSRVHSTGTLMNTVKVTFVELLGSTPENSLMKVILRAYESDRAAPVIYMIKTFLQIGTAGVFLVYSCIYLYDNDEIYSCDASKLKVNSEVNCISPFGYFERILHTSNITLLLYYLIVLFGALTWLMREMCRPMHDFNTTFFSLDLWLSNVDLRRNIGGVAVVEVYGTSTKSTANQSQKI